MNIAELKTANLEAMTVPAIRKIAREFNIVGRDKMTKPKLIAALDDILANAEDIQKPEVKGTAAKDTSKPKAKGLASYEKLENFLEADDYPTLEQIAAFFGIGVPSAQSLISRARKRGIKVLKNAENQYYI